MQLVKTINNLNGIFTVEDFTKWLAGLDEAERREFLEKSDETLFFSRPHRLNFKDKEYDRQKFKELFENAISGNRMFDDKDLMEFVACLYLLSLARIGLEQIKPELTLDKVKDIIMERATFYKNNGSKTATSIVENYKESGLVISADNLRIAREEIEQMFYRYSIVDGEAWYRTEALIPKSDILPVSLDKDLIEKYSQWTNYKIDSEASENETIKFLFDVTKGCLESENETKKLIKILLVHIAEDKQLNIDFSITTVPKGTNLNKLEVLGMDENVNKDFVNLIVMKEGIDFLTPENKAYIQECFFSTKQKYMKLYFHPGRYNGQFIEKGGDYFIVFNGGAHRQQHKMVRLSTAGKVPITINVEEKGIYLPPMISDLRCIRMSTDPKDRFSEEMLKRVIAYSKIEKVILESTYKLGGLVYKD
jgi:hypothetical protein